MLVSSPLLRRKVATTPAQRTNTRYTRPDLVLCLSLTRMQHFVIDIELKKTTSLSSAVLRPCSFGPFFSKTKSISKRHFDIPGYLKDYLTRFDELPRRRLCRRWNTVDSGSVPANLNQTTGRRLICLCSGPMNYLRI